MPRNAAGVYSLPAGNPVVPATTITSVWGNLTMTDLGSELTNSLDRAGRGGMTAALKGIDGVVGTPAYSWTAEPTSGFWRSGAGILEASILGVSISKWNATGFGIGVAAAAKFHVKSSGELGRFESTTVRGSGLCYIDFSDPTGIKGFVGYAGSDDAFGVQNTVADVFIRAGSTERVRVSSGNGWMGVGLTANANWTSSIFRGIEVGPDTTTGAGFAIFGQGSTAAGYLATNAYYDGANFRYKGSTYGSALLRLFNDTSAGFLFQVAPVGVAGNITTFVDVFKVSASGVIADGSSNELGFKVMPTGTVTSGTLTTAERGRCVDMTAAVTLPNGVFAAGDSFALFNTSLGNLAITQGAGLTLRLAGTASTGSRTLAQIGFATVRYFSSSVAIISGAGVT